MIIDTPDNTSMKLTVLKAAGVETIIRYLNPLGRNWKVVTPMEAHAIAQNGMRLGLVSEGFGNFAHQEISAATGVRDAKSAFSYAPTVGAYAGHATIYFAVDTDATTAQIDADVVPYFRSIQAVNRDQPQLWSIGVYGCGAVCHALKSRELVDKAWLANAMGWSGSKQYSHSGAWSIRQHLPTHIAGVDVDTNDANGDIGDFVPFAKVPSPVIDQKPDLVTTPKPDPIPPITSSTAISKDDLWDEALMEIKYILQKLGLR